MRRTPLILASIALLAGCSQAPGGGVDSHTQVPRGGGILGALRPKADPGILAAMQAERAKENAAQAQAGNLPGLGRSSAFGLGRVLPKVITDPIAPPAEEVAKTASTPNNQNMQSEPIVTPADQSAVPVDTPTASQPQEQQAASYPGYSSVPPPPPGALSGGLIPPPPAVTLSTQAQAMAFAPPSPNGQVGNPYANPYANPYFNPYGINYAPVAVPVPVAPSRPAGSPFSTGATARSANDDSDDDKPKKSTANFVPITPTGMEARSPFKQRDDLKILWKGFLATSPDVKSIVKDDKIADQLNHIEVGLPLESTKGSFSISQRQVDPIFTKQGMVDKRLLPTVKKLEMDLVQTYYRYLYSYNKFSLAQQTVQARKQQVEVASSPAESQRAATDLAQAQTEAESVREDMKSAQLELAAAAGANAARTIIGHVSGVTPTLDSLAQSSEQSSADDSKKGGGGGGMFGLGSVESLLGFHHHDKSDKDDADKSDQDDKSKKIAKAEAKEAKAEAKEAKKDKKKDGNKVIAAKPSKEAGNGKEKERDLALAPDTAKSGKGAAADAESAQDAAASRGDISFMLKEVSVTPRKSVLTVSIHNSGSSSFSFGPDSVSISDGAHRIADASVRADFDQTLVQPNQEVKGTITIFGRPWNEKLAVVLSDGGKSIQMKR
jgi:hypothetical protein